MKPPSTFVHHPRKLAAGLLSVALAFSVGACSSTASTSNSGSATATSTATSQTITDQLGHQVTVPTQIDRIADSWPAHTEVLMTLGAGDKIVATANTPKSLPWMFYIQPSLNNAIVTTAQNFNTESLAQKNPDIFFMSPGNANADKIQSMGIPTVQLNFTTYDQMKQTMSITGNILGGDAPARATKFNDNLDQTLASTKKVSDTIPASQKPKVLHIQSFNPLQVDGSDTIIDQWINAAGGVNAAASISGNQKPVSMEQIISWNPDVIIVGDGLPATVNTIETDSAWSTVNAVKNKKVLLDPTGVFHWDRYSPEAVLQIPWAAKTLHPDLFSNIDMVKEVQDYYQNFLNYNLTADQANLILAGEPPASSSASASASGH
ncbi:ABC transporter substrate-binding protein [Propionibacterium sp.]|uniref:ABC transporter substrate-binding protein n=1 Tax=Propionibacterium sp. TaxID=1977903 RepID=UPI0039E79922